MTSLYVTLADPDHESINKTAIQKQFNPAAICPIVGSFVGLRFSGTQHRSQRIEIEDTVAAATLAEAPQSAMPRPIEPIPQACMSRRCASRRGGQSLYISFGENTATAPVPMLMAPTTAGPNRTIVSVTQMLRISRLGRVTVVPGDGGRPGNPEQEI